MSVIPATVAVTLYTLHGIHTDTQVKLGALSISKLRRRAPAPLATAPHAHAAARRRRSWLFLRTPLRIPSAPYITLLWRSGRAAWRWCMCLDHLNSVVLRCSAPLRTVGKCSTTTAVPPEMSKRSAQTLSMLVKVAGRVPVLGRVPSDMRQAAQDEWLQDLHSPRGRRRRTWW